MVSKTLTKNQVENATLLYSYTCTKLCRVKVMVGECRLK